ncbi:benzoate carboxyl methyltransferase-like, partial [Punica granatum]|uniref:Benzoate carboxyl methyltransferase-like n=1 Tax=Punica granatum TaxID=22663 RepID=A0A6P8BQA4_PUNGR
SFYGRLFPSRSLHFVHSSYSVHWLSQIGHRTDTSFRSTLLKEMMRFIERYELRKSPANLILSLPPAKTAALLWWWLSRSLVEMADEGLVEAADIDSFNLPLYPPYKHEVRDVVEEEGSFTINRLETFEVNWDPFCHEDDENCLFDKLKSGRNVADCVRSATEPILRSHFGERLMMDDLFERYARLVGEHLSVEKTKHFNIAVSMTRK